MNGYVDRNVIAFFFDLSVTKDMKFDVGYGVAKIG